MRKSTREQYRDKRKPRQPPKLLTGTSTEIVDELLKMMCHDDAMHASDELLPKLNPTQRDFIYSPDNAIAYGGPAGCAKTSSLVAREMIRLLLHPGHKSLLARLHYNDLLGTTAERAERMLNRLPPGMLVDRQKTPPMIWYIKPIIDGPLSELWFMGLDDGLGSYDWNSAGVDEADEVEETRVNEITTRLRTPGGHHSLALVFNKPAKTHWLYTACTGKDFQDRQVKDPAFRFYEPQARENARNLPNGYYDRMKGTKEQLMRLRDGQWGETFPGDPVYPQYEDSIHGRDDLISRFDPDLPLVVCLDFGYNHPAAVWMQQSFEGHLLHFKCIVPSNIEIDSFADLVLAITATHFPGAKRLIYYGDPAARQKKDTGSTLHKLHKKGITLMYQPNITIARGLGLCRDRLEKLIAHEPAMQFDRVHCAVLISALKGGYRLARDGVTPFKDGFYEHPADAWRYGVWNMFGNGTPVTAIPDSVAYRSTDDYVVSPGGNVLIPASLMPGE